MIIKLSKPCYIYQLSVLYILEFFFINFSGDISTKFERYFINVFMWTRRGFCVRHGIYIEYFHFEEKAFRVHEENSMDVDLGSQF